jgi:glutamine amidotransferase
MRIAILDYGMGNLRSVQKGFAQAGTEAQIISRPEEIDAAERLVLPGVGAFKDAIATLRGENLAEAIVRHINRGKLFLGICLGLQMLFDVGYEDGEHRGLGVVKGKCVRFDVDKTMGLKVPHMGWNQLIVRKNAVFILCMVTTWCRRTIPSLQRRPIMEGRLSAASGVTTCLPHSFTRRRVRRQG